MSTVKRVIACVVGLMFASVALGENRIYEWSGHDPNDIQIDQYNALVSILAPGTYKFEALDVDPNDPNTVWGLGVFQEIEVDPNCPQGTVNLYIARDPNQGGGPGATDVYYLELLNAQNVTVNIAEMRVDDSLPDVAATATTGPVVAYSIDSITLDYLGGDVDCTSLGDVTVSDGLTDEPTITVDGGYAATMTFVDLPALAIAGDLVGDVAASGDAQWSGVVAGDLEGSFEVAGDCDPDITLEFGSISGTLTLGQTEGSPFAASVLVDANVAADSEVNLPAGLDADGLIDADGTWSGTLTCSGDLAGDLTGDVIGYDYIEHGVDLSGSIAVKGSVGSATGWIYFEGRLHGPGGIGEPNDPPIPAGGGSIAINGALRAGARIWFEGGMAGTEPYVAVNYDGYGLETWEPDARIILGADNDPNNVYYGNTPGKHLWAISECRCDMNNDTSVDFADINPFIAALTHPADYALQFPGLDGSRVWKGDANCDGSFNGSDSNSFIARVISHCCDPDCPGCEGQDGGGLPPPEELAAELANSVWQELYDELLDLIADLINAQDDNQEYWQAVYAALTE